LESEDSKLPIVLLLLPENS